MSKVAVQIAESMLELRVSSTDCQHEQPVAP